ncbi:thioredoxin domain protein [Bacteriovorax sp. BSW11_IV]|uniref:thioredoxin family protein n=1 Tax=Bacteriovorax sp. BSW11_IV TaxID=1353529 RepID=UPI00038A3666|nr:thioredoxin family protein [Bacteriovorax sp. BSW11_IV]EQC43045.1 thioredoxin domain protein [Bacteriovorax sp. BSW11_IV]
MDTKLTLENFDAQISSQRKPFAIKFGSTTCGPCNTMAPVLDKVRTENPHFMVFEVDTDEEPELASHFGIRAVPTIHICEDREILYSFHGITPYRDIQYLIDNINDPHFRTHGSFKTSDQKKSYTFELIVLVLIALFASLFIFL